jgi:preprotein translocase subunit YajC
LEFLMIGMAGGPAGAGAGGQAGGQAGGLGGMSGMMLPMLAIFAIMYFMMIRPQQRKEKERLKMIGAVKSGDRVLFGGGILGMVTNVKENTLIVRVADDVKIEVLRASVQKVLEKGEKAAGDVDAGK